MHDQAAVHFRDDLESRGDPRRTRTSTPYAGAATQKTFVIRVRGQLNRRFFWKLMHEFNAASIRRPAYESKRLFPVSVLVCLHEFFADLIVVAAEKTEARVTPPRHLEGHDVSERPARIQERPGQDDNHAIGGAVFQAHDQVAVG